MFRKLLTVALLGLVTLGLYQSPARAATVEVDMRDDNTFMPADVKANAGDTILFKNAGIIPHTATSKDADFDSGNVLGSAQFQVATTKDFPPTFAYDCTYHVAQGMKGTITLAGATGEVKAAASPVAPVLSPSPSPLPKAFAARWWARTSNLPVGLRVFAPLAIALFGLLMAMAGLGFLRALKKARQG